MEDRALMFALGDVVTTVDKMRGAATRFIFSARFKEQFHIVGTLSDRLLIRTYG